jgi:Flp pilus assembly protein TadG
MSSPQTPQSTTRGERRAALYDRGESGQVIVMFTIFAVVLIGFGALVIDLGKVWWVRRESQATADAAALAAAQDLPSPATASATANTYLIKNPITGSTTSSINVIARCRPGLPGCYPDNALDVTVNATVPTTFAGVLGMNTVNVSATATACRPCSWKKADIVMIQDRTGSMDAVSNGGDGGLAASQVGIDEMLTILNPQYDRIALAVLPPAKDNTTFCTQPAPAKTTTSGNYYNYDAQASPYVVQGFSTDYQNANGTLNNGSLLVQDVACLKAGGNTAYAAAVDAGQAYLNANARVDAKKIIIFLTDGAANSGPAWAPASYKTTPCHAGETEAQTAAAAGTTVYTIAYDSGNAGNCMKDVVTGPNGSGQYTHSNGTVESGGITPNSALAAMASNPAYYFDQPTQGQLTSIFEQISTLIGDDSLIPAGT